MSSYGYYEHEYRDGKRLKTGPADWFLLAGYLFVAVLFFVSVAIHDWHLTNATSIFLIGALPFWVLRSFVGVSWKAMMIGVILLPIVAFSFLLASIDVWRVLATLLTMLMAAIIIYRRQVIQSLPTIKAFLRPERY